MACGGGGGAAALAGGGVVKGKGCAVLLCALASMHASTHASAVLTSQAMAQCGAPFDRNRMR